MTTHFPHRTFKPLLLSLLLSIACGSAYALEANSKSARFYEDALQRFERKDYPGAIIQLKNSLQIDKNQLTVHLLLGKALLANSEVANAEFEFTEALRLGVNRAEIVVPLAKALLEQGKQPEIFTDDRLKVEGLPAGIQMQLLLLRSSAASDTGDARAAMSAVMDARAINPASPDSWLAEVPLRIRARQFKEAAAAADQAIKLAPDSSEALYQKASVLHVQGQIAAALPAYDKVLQLDNGHLEARLARAGLLIDLNRDKDAQADLTELAHIAPRDPRAGYLRALLADRAGNAAASKAALKSVTDLMDPVPINFIRYRTQMLMLNGLAHFGLNEMEKAKPYLDYAVRLQPNSPVAKLQAQMAMGEPNYARAIDLLEDYLKGHPGDGQALLMLSTAHMQLGHYAKATSLLQDALQAKDSPEFRTALGLSLLRSGKFSTATGELEKSFKADPNQTYAGLALVTVYLRSGQVPKALLIANNLAKANPKNPSILLIQAAAKFAAGDYKGSRGVYEAALKLDDHLLDAKLGLARIEFAGKDFDAADKRLRAILRGDERNPDILFELATLYELWGKPDQAEKWLESAAEASNQTQTRANFALVAWNLKRNQAPAALDAAKVLLSKLPNDVTALMVYASAQLANKDLVGARSTLTNASRRAAFEAPTLEKIARAQLDAADLAGAAYSLDKALTGAPDYLPAMALMSTVELIQGDAAKSERRARQIIQTYPKAAIGYGLLADVALKRGQNSQAVEALRHAFELEKSDQTMLRLFKALSNQDGGKPAIALAQDWIKAHPGDVVVQKSLADAQARAGNYAAARHGYESVVKLRPNDAEALNNLANVLIRQKDASAVTVAEQALAQAPSYAQVIDTAGWANFLAGNKERALQLLRDARLRDPANPELRYHLAAVLATAGRKSEAKDELQIALASKDFESSQDARSLMATLK